MTQRTSTEIAVDLADYRAARSALVKGERIEDVWRDGRRMRFSRLSLEDIETAIASLEREYAQAVSAESGASARRRPIRLAYRN